VAGGAAARPGGAAARGALAAARLRQVGAGAAPAAAARLRGVRRAGRQAGYAVPGAQEGATMMQARDEARARIAARLGLTDGAGHAALGSPAPLPARALAAGVAVRRVDDGRLRLVRRRQVAATSGWRVAAIDCRQLAVAPQRTPG
jgi:hypothetical protein